MEVGKDGNSEKSPAPVTWSRGGSGASTPGRFLFGFGQHQKIKLRDQGAIKCEASGRDLEPFGM